MEDLIDNSVIRKKMTNVSELEKLEHRKETRG